MNLANRQIDPAPATPSPGPAAWQTELARGYGTVGELLAALDLTPEACGASRAAEAAFTLRVPLGFARRMQPGNPRDPLLMQVLPAIPEDVATPGYGPDPVGDLRSVRAPGLLQKYAGRALLVTTGACAVHCRYCFRRDFPYADVALTGSKLGTAVQAIADDPSLREIILSGGDPLVLGEARLEELLRALDAVPHLERIRLHTRVPVVLPDRVDSTLLALLRSLRKRIVVVIHANHPREIDAGVASAIRSLNSVAGPVLNQSVLLRGINATAGVLVDLSTALFAAGALPYYLHQLDPVAGAAHFAVSDQDAIALSAEVARRLPGYLVPRLVRERAGEPAKTLLGPFGAT